MFSAVMSGAALLAAFALTSLTDTTVAKQDPAGQVPSKTSEKKTKQKSGDGEKKTAPQIPGSDEAKGKVVPGGGNNPCTINPDTTDHAYVVPGAKPCTPEPDCKTDTTTKQTVPGANPCPPKEVKPKTLPQAESSVPKP